MSSLYEELRGRIEQDPRLTKRGGARSDLGMLLFNAHEDLWSLWVAADRCVDGPNGVALAALSEAVDRLRPIFGDRRGGPGAR